MEHTEKDFHEDCTSVCEAGCEKTNDFLEKMQWKNIDEETLMQLQDICTNAYNC